MQTKNDTPITARATRIVQVWDVPSARHVHMEYVFVHTAKQLERDLTEAREIIAAALRALPVGYLPAHTPESIPARIEDLCQTIVETERELAEAREQRDTLAEALDELIITEGRGLDQWERDAFAKAKQAIAAVKGGEP